MGLHEGRRAVLAARACAAARHHVGRAGGPPNPALLARNAYIGMIETAQNVADRYAMTREEIDAFALRSQQHAKAARDSGRLAKEIMPVQIAATKKTPERLRARRVHPRRHHRRALAELPAQPGTTQMTAANSTPLTDGASAIVLASGERAAELGVDTAGARGVVGRVRARSAHHGVGAGLGDAVGDQACRADPRTDRRVEVHEAFSAQALGVLRELPNQLGGFTVPDENYPPMVAPFPSDIPSARPAPGMC